MENTRRLLRWAKDTQDVQLNGIEPRALPGRGIGVVANRKIKAGQVLLTVPQKAVRSLHTIPVVITRRLPAGTSIHGLLAAELALGWKKPPYPAWNAVLPTMEDIEASVPFMWPSELQRLLPSAARQILDKQERMFTRDWKAVSSSFADKVKKRDYSYAWLLVNSRTFYYETPDTAQYPWEDRLAQLPVADLFNHAEPGGCKASYSSSGYEFRAQRDYGAGQEIHISYGDHSNDYLLAEYGFVMNPNKWDEVYLDDVVLPRLDERQKAELQKGSKSTGGFVLKKAQLDASSVGPKLEAALKLLSKGSSKAPDQLLSELINEYLIKVKQIMVQVQATKAGTEAQRGLLMRRWDQIQSMLEKNAQSAV